jgi:hypothetical protein
MYRHASPSVSSCDRHVASSQGFERVSTRVSLAEVSIGKGLRKRERLQSRASARSRRPAAHGHGVRQPQGHVRGLDSTRIPTGRLLARRRLTSVWQASAPRATTAAGRTSGNTARRYPALNGSGQRGEAKSSELISEMVQRLAAGPGSGSATLAAISRARSALSSDEGARFADSCIADGGGKSMVFIYVGGIDQGAGTSIMVVRWLAGLLIPCRGFARSQCSHVVDKARQVTNKCSYVVDKPG